MTSTAYPTVTGARARRFFDSCDVERLASTPPEIEELPIDWITSTTPVVADEEPAQYETRALYDLAKRAWQAADEGAFAVGLATQSGDRFEAAFAVELHELLRELPGRIMNDRGFWRFLALGPFFSCTVWRQRNKNLPSAFGLPPSTGRRLRERSFDLKRNLPWRLYMRAEIGGPALVDVIGSDLWWSHLFRVDIGRSQPTAHAFLEMARTRPIAIQRRIAPLVTASRGRFVFDALDDDEVAERVEQELARATGQAPRAEVDREDVVDPILEDDDDDPRKAD